MKNKLDFIQEENNYYRNQHMQEVEIYNLKKEEIKKLNSSISHLNREKETISSSTVYIKRHLEQLDEKVIKQVKNTRGFIDIISTFERKLKSNRINEIN